MPSKVIKLKEFEYKGHQFDVLWVILDAQSSPPILPLCFTAYLSRYATVFELKEISDISQRRRVRSFVTNEISDSTIRSYVYCLAKFLSHLDLCQASFGTPGMHASSSCSERFVDDYINRILACNLKSYQSLDTHRSALMAYFNFLDYMEISPHLNLRIHRKTRQLMAEKCNSQNHIQYVSRYWRTALLNSCETLAEKLMMRMGYEVGLRTSELMGLRTAGPESLLDLFARLENPDFEHVIQFRYRLDGRYTKGSKSRWIYFDRDLLVDMKRYFNTERKWIVDKTNLKDPSFFLRTDKRFIGTGIQEEQASRVFHKRAMQAGLNPNLSFHDLRHTFATELFQAELEGPDGRETRSESAALIVVAQRLGHAFGRDGHASPVTTRYIRMRLQMQELEAPFNE